MTTVYPGALDALANPVTGNATPNPSHIAQHADINDATEAIEAELGITPSGAAATVVARLNADEAALAAHLVDTGDAHDASTISILDTAGDFTATEVEGALAELQADAETDAAALVTHDADKTVVHGFADTDKVPRGVLGYAEVTADQGSITTEVDLTGLSVAVTVLASRRIRITADVAMQSTVAADATSVRIKESTTQFQSRALVNSVASWPDGLGVSVVLTPSVGAHTYKLTALRSVGTGTVSLRASSTTPNFILVEDIGAA